MEEFQNGTYLENMPRNLRELFETQGLLSFSTWDKLNEILFNVNSGLDFYYIFIYVTNWFMVLLQKQKITIKTVNWKW